MREVVNISLSKELNHAIDSLMKKGKYSTKSEFLRDIIREKLYEADLDYQIKKSREEFKAGKGKLLKSLADLD